MTEPLQFASLVRRFAGIAPAAAPAVWLFPGLGCRYVGMGCDLFERSGVASELLSQAEDMLGYRLAPVCLEGSGRKVVPARQEAQVIYVLSCAYAAALLEQGYRPSSVLGHSLGSWAAAWAAGVYDFDSGLELVTQVEKLLEDQVDGHGLTMGALIGLNAETVESLIGGEAGVSIANFNSPAQYVVGGPEEGVERVLQGALGRGAKRAGRLPTVRAIHTPWLDDLLPIFEQKLARVMWSKPDTGFVACDRAEKLGSGEEVRQFFSVFLAKPVQWELSFRSLLQNPLPEFVEVGPGNLLTTLASFIEPAASVHTASELLDAAS